VITKAGRRYDRDGARAQKREETKRKLLDAAEALMAARGIADTTVTEIGRVAGVSPSLINSYFGGKGGLIHGLVQRLNAARYEDAMALHAAPGPAWERLSGILRMLARCDLANPGLLAALHAFSWSWSPQREAEHRAERRAYLAMIARVVADGTRDGEFHRIDPIAAAHAIWAVYTFGIRPGVFDGKSAEACADTVLEIVAGLLKP